MHRQPKAKPVDLTINLKTERSFLQDDVESPDAESSPMNLEGIDLSSFGGDFGSSLADLPPLPLSPPPPGSPGLQKDPSKTFFGGELKTRTGSEQAQRAEPPRKRSAREDDESRPGSNSMSKIYHLRKNPGSTPELSLLGSAENVGKHTNEVNDLQIPETRPQPIPQQSEDTVSIRRKEKGFRNPLARSKSTRKDSNSSSSKSKPSTQTSFEHPPKTAPLQSNLPSSENVHLKTKNAQKRGKSAERAIASESEDNLVAERPHAKERDKGGFVTGSKNVMTKAKSGGGHFLKSLGKIGRSSSHHEKEIPDSEYVIGVINLPLVEQTRATRISKDLTKCRDKTEYWMPSLPWRCIDYLNMACESEGLYRIPGSTPQVKHWQRRFDTELDVDLLSETELYDPNIISSMLKSWLRDLPTEIMPKSLQHELAAELESDGYILQKLDQEIPQKLRDCLSNLPPFNYYLLFAITCHLSLLLSHREKNKMDLGNLYICTGPATDLEPWLFNHLVGLWKNCWQGCFTEKQYLEAEKAYERGEEYESPALPQKSGASDTASRDKELSKPMIGDERAIHSSGSDSETVQRDRSPQRQKENVKPETYKPAGSPRPNGSAVERKPVPSPDTRRPSTANAGEKSPRVDSEAFKVGTPRPTRHSRTQSDLPLSPIKPTSPLDFKFQMQGQ